MKRDTIKTLIGLLIIGIIVVATFMYGNAQRQAQLRHDQDVKKQQEDQAKKTTPSVAATPTPAVGAAPTKTPAPKTPTTGGTGADLPETGSPLVGLVGVTAIVGMGLALRRSRRGLVDAVRGRR